MIKKVKTGWRVDVRPEGVLGPRIRKTFKTLAEAKRFEIHIRGKAAVGAPYSSDRDKRRLQELVQLWYDSHGVTLKDGKQRFNKMTALASMMGNPVAASLTAMDASRFRQKRLADGIQPNTANHDQAYLRAMFNRLAKLGEWSGTNPFAAMEPLQLDEPELTYLTDDDISQLLKHLSRSANPDVLLITRLCLATGARWSEAQYLRAESLRNGRVTYTGTKNGRNRTIPLPEGLYLELVDHGTRIGRLFPTSAYNAFSQAVISAGIVLPRGQRTHVLRHTFASHFMMNGGDVLTLQKILGHQAITMTMRYAHLSPDHLADALKFAPNVDGHIVDTTEEREGVGRSK